MKRALPSADKRETLASLADSRIGQLLQPLTLLIDRNSKASLTYENVRVLTLAFAYLRSEEVPGDYAEFGVWTGATFTEAWRAARRVRESTRHFWAFDSFEGLPEPGGVDATGRFAAGEFTCDRRSFEQRLRNARVPPKNVHIVEGFFDSTLAGPDQVPLERVAIAWVDCDLYASTIPVLDFLTRRLADGAVLLFDDWFCFKGASDRGEAKACREWLQRNPEITLVPWRQFNWAGQAFIVRRNDG